MSVHSDFARDQELSKKVNLTSWQHQFAPSGNQKQIGENKDILPDGEHPLKIMSREMYCVHCKQSYWTVVAGPPSGPCPARNKKREMKRILG